MKLPYFFPDSMRCINLSYDHNFEKEGLYWKIIQF